MNSAEEVLATAIRCERLKAKLSPSACEDRQGWDSTCAGCDRNPKPLKDYGKYRCVCGVLVTKEGGKCFKCGHMLRGKEPIIKPEALKMRPTVKPDSISGGGKVLRPRGEKCKELAAAEGKRVARCASCGAITRIIARGLGSVCWYREKEAGTLDSKFPAKAKRVRGEKKPVEQVEAAERLLSPVREKAVPAPELTILLSFNRPRDRELYKRLEDSAEINRRTLLNQVMAVLEDHVRGAQV